MKKRLAGLLALLMAAAISVAGCGAAELDGSAEAVNMDGVSIPVGEVNFFLRYQQISLQSMFGSYFGEDFMNQDLTGTGTIYGETMRENIVDQMTDYYIVEAHADELGISLSDTDVADAETAAQEFCSANDSKTLKAMSADEATVAHVLKLAKLQEMVYDHLAATIDTEVDEAEVAQKRISYVTISTVGESDADGNVTEPTEEELAEKKAQLETVLAEAKESGDLSAAAEAHDLTASTTTYGSTDNYLNDAVKEAANQLQDGEFSDVIEAESGYYIVYMESTYDEDATQTQINSILSQREQEAYDNWLDPLKEASEITTNDDVIGQLSFERIFEMKAAE